MDLLLLFPKYNKSGFFVMIFDEGADNEMLNTCMSLIFHLSDVNDSVHIPVELECKIVIPRRLTSRPKPLQSS